MIYSLNRRTATWNLFVLYNKKTNYYSFFISKSFSITRKPTFAHFGEHEKSHLSNLLSIQNEAISLVAVRSKELWLVQKITPLSNLTQRASRGMKTYSVGRIELPEKSSQFLTSGDAKRWNEVFMGTPICKCVTHSLRCRHWNGWNGNRAVRARRHIEIETAHHQITQKQRTFVAIRYNKYLVSQNIYLFK